MRPLGPPGSPVQKALTLLTGAPLSVEDCPRETALRQTVTASLSLVVGVLLSIVACLAGGGWLLLLLPIWVITLHGMRKLRAVIMHQAAHRNLFRRPKLDHAVGEFISILLLSEEFEGYRRSHMADHHGEAHQTLSDPTVAFLFDELGLRTGMAPAEMWRRLLITLFSPSYHGRFATSRLRAHFTGTSIAHRLAVLAYIFALVAGLVFGGAKIIVLAWLIPLGPLTQCALAVRLASEHLFVSPMPKRRGKHTLGMFTCAIFAGEAAPVGKQGLPGALAWAAWASRMLLWHLPMRLIVLPGDGPCHDLHHQEPGSKDWPNYIARRAVAAREADPTRAEYIEVWGLLNAIDRCFRSLSDARPEDFPYAQAPRRQLVNQ